jgi:uncharacterized protein YkwD
MGRIRILLALAIAVCAIAATAFATTGVAAAKSPEANMMHKVNHYRLKHGLHRVKWADSLKRSARKYAWYMMRSQYFGHSRRIHASSRYKRLGEILEYQRGRRPNVNLAFHTWLGSSPHRAIILDPKFTYAGAGRAWGRFKGHRAMLWVMHFGRP